MICMYDWKIEILQLLYFLYTRSSEIRRPQSQSSIIPSANDGAFRFKTNVLGAPALYIVYFAKIIIITYAFPVMSHI